MKDLKAIDATAYLAATETVSAGNTVAVLIAEGEITGMPELGGMTPDGINGVIDEIQEDPKVKALVVRVNSPGGDAVAAELIRARLVEYKKKTGNPVIISMGDTCLLYTSSSVANSSRSSTETDAAGSQPCWMRPKPGRSHELGNRCP